MRQDFIQWCGGIVKFDVVIGHKYLVLSISSREDDAAGETKTLARFIQLFKVIIALAYMLLVVGIIAFFSQLEGYVKVHHDNFYGQVYSFYLRAGGYLEQWGWCTTIARHTCVCSLCKNTKQMLIILLLNRSSREIREREILKVYCSTQVCIHTCHTGKRKKL